METHNGFPEPRASQNIARYTLGGFMAFAGIGHLTFSRKEFRAQVPNWFPVGKDATVLGSGVAEVALGAALLAAPKYRRESGIALAAFYLLIFPGNVAQYAERKNGFGLDTDTKRLARLFFQPPLVAAALWAGGIPRAHRNSAPRG